MTVPAYTVRKILKAFRGGSSWPVLIETDGPRCVMKWRGNAEGPAVNAVDLIALRLAKAVGLPVPTPHLLTLTDAAVDPAQDPELNDLVRRSIGTNLGVEEIVAFTPYQSGDRARVPTPLQDLVLAFDLLWLNMDRTEGNPNMVMTDSGLLCWDFAASMELRLILEGRTIDERRFYPLLRQHPFFTDRIPDLSGLRTLTPGLVEQALQEVPDDWIPSSTDRRRVLEILSAVAADAAAIVRRRHEAVASVPPESAEERSSRTASNRRAFEEAAKRLADRSGTPRSS